MNIQSMNDPARRRTGRMVFACVMVAIAMICSSSQVQAQTMSFSVLTASGIEGCGKKCKAIIVAQGDIDNSSGDRFDKLVKDQFGNRPKGLTVLLESSRWVCHGRCAPGTHVSKISRDCSGCQGSGFRSAKPPHSSERSKMHLCMRICVDGGCETSSSSRQHDHIASQFCKPWLVPAGRT